MEEVLFKDRADAAKQLIKKIPPTDPSSTIVLGIPRGGVPMAAQIADALHLPLDLLLIRKLTTTQNPEYAIGAVSLNRSWVDERPPVSDTDLNKQIEEGRQVLRKRNAFYRKNRPFPSLHDKTVLLVDDGIATGRTLLHGIEEVRSQQPKAIWVIVPVSSREAASLIGPRVERLICLYQPAPFIGVGRFYQSFPPVEDEEVVKSIETKGEEGRNSNMFEA